MIHSISISHPLAPLSAPPSAPPHQRHARVPLCLRRRRSHPAAGSIMTAAMSRSTSPRAPLSASRHLSSSLSSPQQQPPPQSNLFRLYCSIAACQRHRLHARRLVHFLQAMPWRAMQPAAIVVPAIGSRRPTSAFTSSGSVSCGQSTLNDCKQRYFDRQLLF